MSQPWPTWEPRMARENRATAQSLVQYTCPACGWQGEKVRPEVAGTFVLIAGEAQAHLDVVHNGRWPTSS